MGTATTGYEDLKNIAVGRLFLDNVPHIKTHWPMVTPFLSQIALSFGCDDVEGTVVYERVYHEAGAHTQMHMPYLELVRLIRGAGKRPVERDSLYQPVREQFDDPPPEPTLRRGAALAGGARRMRLGRIPWINCYPVYGAIDRGLRRVPAELVTGTASELNDLLAAGELAGERGVGRGVCPERGGLSPAAGSRHHLRRAGPQRRAVLSPAGRRAGRLHGAAHGLVANVGAAAGPASRATGGTFGPATPPRGRRPPISPGSPACRTRPCSSSATRRCMLAGRGGVPGPRGSRRRVEGLDRPAVRLRGVGRAPGRAARRRAAVHGGCSSRGPGASSTSTSWRATRRARPAFASRSAARTSAISTTRSPIGTWRASPTSSGGWRRKAWCRMGRCRSSRRPSGSCEHALLHGVRG